MDVCTKKCQNDVECCILCECRGPCKLKCSEPCEIVKQAAQTIVFNHKAASLIRSLQLLMKEFNVEKIETDKFKVIAAGKEKSSGTNSK